MRSKRGLRLAKAISVHKVADACRDYLAWFGAHRKSLRGMQLKFNALILPPLGKIELGELTTAKLRAWHENLAATAARTRRGKDQPVRYRKPPDDAEGRRRRKATANRTLTILKAALNHAWREGNAASDEAMRACW